MIQPKKRVFDGRLAGIVLAGLLFRLLLWKTVRQMVTFDEANYLRMAGMMRIDGLQAVLHPYWAPGFPLAVGSVHLIGAGLEQAARWINVLSGTGVILLIWAWTRRILSPGIARISAALLAFWPGIAFSNTDAMPESLYTLLALGGLYLFTRAAQKGSFLKASAAGLCLAGAYLVKPEGIALPGVVLAVSLLYSAVKICPLRPGRIWLQTGSLVLVFALTSLPYWLYLKQITGHWTVSSKASVNQQMESAVYFNDGPVRDPFFHLTSDYHLPYDMAMHFGNLSALQESREGRSRVQHIALSRYAVKYVKNLHEIVQSALPELLGSVLFLLFVLGFFNVPLPRDKCVLILPILAALAVFWLGVVPMFHVNLRYFRPLLPLIFIWAGQGLFLFMDWIGKSRAQWDSGPPSTRTAAAFGLIFLLGLGMVPETARIFQKRRVTTAVWDQAVELKQAALWLKAQTDEPPRLMTLNKAIDFYAGQMDMQAGASFSYDSVEKNVEYARRKQVDYLVFSSRYLSWFENLAPLITQQEHPGLQRIYHRREANGIETVIYQLVDA